MTCPAFACMTPWASPCIIACIAKQRRVAAGPTLGYLLLNYEYKQTFCALITITVYHLSRQPPTTCLILQKGKKPSRGLWAALPGDGQPCGRIIRDIRWVSPSVRTSSIPTHNNYMHGITRPRARLATDGHRSVLGMAKP